MLGFAESATNPSELMRHKFPSKIGGSPVSLKFPPCDNSHLIIIMISLLITLCSLNYPYSLSRCILPRESEEIQSKQASMSPLSLIWRVAAFSDSMRLCIHLAVMKVIGARNFATSLLRPQIGQRVSVAWLRVLVSLHIAANLAIRFWLIL